MIIVRRKPASVSLLYLLGLFLIVAVILSFLPRLEFGRPAIASVDFRVSTDGSPTGGKTHTENSESPPAPGTTEAPVTGLAVVETYLPLIHTPTGAGSASEGWPMAGANPERNSRSLDEVRGDLKPVWYRPIEPFIPHRVQIIGAYDTIYLSTARGLYAFNAATGADKWVYPTEFPLGHSPTVAEGVVYVGGLDHKIHAIDAFTGQKLWTFEGGAGFDTNPLVIGDKLFAGNRDGYFYAIYTQGSTKGQLAWKFKTEGPIHFSAAYTDGAVYFASDDSHAYALQSSNGALLWKSAKLPGSGFHSWWPVIFGEYVIFAGSNNYRFGSDLGPGSLPNIEYTDVFPNYATDPKGKLVGPLGEAPGPWVNGTPTIDMSKSNGGTLPVTEYFEQKPWRRTYLVLNKSTGTEKTWDFDSDGKPEYAPILWFGVDGAGNRYPPVVGSNGILYQTNNYMSDPSIPGGQVSGWQFGTPYISPISTDWGAIDEPHAYAAAGDLIYWNVCCDRQSGSIDIGIPNTLFAENVANGDLPASGLDKDREYRFPIGPDTMPGYNVGYYGSDKSSYASFGGKNGVYGYHGDVSAPIPYNGMVYTHRSNALIAYGPGPEATSPLPVAETVDIESDVSTLNESQLKAKLANEVQKILDAGHLRPGYLNSGIFDFRAKDDCGDYLADYWHHPADVIYYLIRALPYLDAGLQSETLAYIQAEYNAFKPYQYNHIGWNTGAAREPYLLPPEVSAAMANYGPKEKNNNFDGWEFAPHQFYALWKYAELFGNATAIFDASKTKLPPVPADSVLLEMPHVHNAFIAGYTGYLELEALAGNPPSADVQADLDDLLSLRATNFSKDTSDAYFSEFDKYYCRTLNVSRNFMYLVPELADYLRVNALGKVQEALAEYETIAPYWFVSNSETTFAEGILVPAYDYHALFQAKALILQEPRSQLTPFIDVPSFAIGDLFYIDNLISAIEAN
jgi:outer membrane protein assembly factor BamB